MFWLHALNCSASRHRVSPTWTRVFLKLCGLKYGSPAASKAPRKIVRIGDAVLQCLRAKPTASNCLDSPNSYRGRFGASDDPAQPAAPPDLRDAAVEERFRMPPGGGWAFGSLTGDYNGIHCWPWYARRFGFRAAFLHPQRVAGLCMARLAGPRTEAQTLELWLKGPVFYCEEVALSTTAREGAVQFGLALAGDSRMALLGSWHGAAAPN